jgi:methyl-accepting chemotaxis protein
MNFFNKISIRYKILSIAAVAIVGFAVNFAVNYSVASNNVHHLEQMRDMVFPALQRSEKNLVRLDQVINKLDEAVATEEEDIVEEAQETVAAMQAAFSEIAELDPSLADTMNTLKAGLDAYFTAAQKLTMGMLSGDTAATEIQAQVQAMQPKLKAFRGGLTQLRDERLQAFMQTVKATNEAANSSITIGAIIGAILVLVLMATTFFVASGIMRAIADVSDNLREIARGEGDLTRRLQAGSQDEVGQLVDYFNTFMGKLQGIIQELKGYSGSVGSAAEELSSITQKSRDGMERQRVETDQVATASNEMAATVAEVAQNAELAAEAASSANAAASGGSGVVDETIAIINRLAGDVEQGADAVNQLQSESENVGTVLDVIRGIAEQTNLLALNAAIEAARAGEQGRGFAVVADEVRTLASRTQESTQEIQAMIEKLQNSAGQAADIMKRSKDTSQQGVSKAAEAGEALQEITSAVTVISDMNAQIASASEEQSSVAMEMDKNISNINRATEENAESSNQLAHAGESLNHVAVQMQETVGQFKV